MVYRVLAGLAFSLMSWLFLIWSGAFGGSSFNTNFFGDGELVERPVTEVYAALDAIDMDGSGELEVLSQVPQVRKLTVPGQSIAWTVYAGDSPAMTVDIALEPAHEGAATVVRTDITRHKLPAGHMVAPAFKVPGGLELALRMQVAHALAPMDSDYAREVQKAQMSALTPVAMVREANRQFAPHMRKSENGKDAWMKENEKRYRAARNDAANRATGVSFAPGQPMVDPTVR